MWNFLYQVISKGAAEEKNFYGQESCNDMQLQHKDVGKRNK